MPTKSLSKFLKIDCVNDIVFPEEKQNFRIHVRELSRFHKDKENVKRQIFRDVEGNLEPISRNKQLIHFLWNLIFEFSSMKQKIRQKFLKDNKKFS